MAHEKLNTKIRQDQILNAALEIVSAQGMKGLSIGGIARRIGLMPSAIYRHFDGKDNIIDALLGLIESRLLANVAAARKEADVPLAVLHVLLKMHARMIRENAGIPRVVFSEEVYGMNSTRKRRVYELLQGYLEHVATLFSEAQQAGAVRKDIRPSELSVMFLGLVQPPAILWHISDGGFDVTHQVDQAWRLFCDAITRPDEIKAKQKLC